jgi:CubicO group peptidase (beta-lactamase class C family)
MFCSNSLKLPGDLFCGRRAKQITLRHLLTHTSGFSGPGVNTLMAEYFHRFGPLDDLTATPLVFEPGERWQYGRSTDWAGRVVEKVSGKALEQYCQANSLGPLGMVDTSYFVPKNKFGRLVTPCERQSDGALKQDVRKPSETVTYFLVSSGIYSIIVDLTRFMQMSLRDGRAAGSDRILQPQSVKIMATNQIGTLSASKLELIGVGRPPLADFHPDAIDGFGLGFLINKTAYPGGRSAGSLAWAGGYNTFYWIDPHQRLCAVLMMQFHPFFDSQAIEMLRHFELATYASFA